MNKSNSEALPRPEEYPVGSPESRAAARALLERRLEGRKRLTIILNPYVVCDPTETEPHITPWREGVDGTLVRTMTYPQGMTLEEAKRKLGISED